MLLSITKFCFKKYRIVISIWLIALVAFVALASSYSGEWLDQGALPNTESSKAIEVLKKINPDLADNAAQYGARIVFESKDGIINHEKEIDAYLNTLVAKKDKTNIATFQSPFDKKTNGIQISDDGNISYAEITFESGIKLQKAGVPSIDLAKDLRKSITVEFSGQGYQNFEIPSSEAIGIFAALLILLFAFGSLIAAGVPIFTAIVGIVISSSVVALIANLVGIPEFTTQVAAMIGIGVGIDYALFIVTRYRESLARGNDRESATIEAMTTSGAAVLFAGMTVVISLLGMLFIGLEFINGLAIGTSITVFIMVLGALTFVPALLGSVIGKNLHRLSVPQRKVDPNKKKFWVRWSEFIQRRALISLLLGVVILGTLAIPLFSLRVGASDDSNVGKKETVRKSYELLAKGFGPGFNGPLLIVLDSGQAGKPEVLAKVVGELEAIKNIESVFPSSQVIKAASQNANAMPKPGESQISVINVKPKTGPQDEATTNLINQLRNDILPKALKDSDANTNAKTYVSGFTAFNADFATVMGERIPIFITAVLILSFLLLMAVFRSVLVALKVLAISSIF